MMLSCFEIRILREVFRPVFDRLWMVSVNDNIVVYVFIICQKLQHVQIIYKLPHSYVLIDLHSNPPKRP